MGLQLQVKACTSLCPNMNVYEHFVKVQKTEKHDDDLVRRSAAQKLRRMSTGSEVFFVLNTLKLTSGWRASLKNVFA